MEQPQLPMNKSWIIKSSCSQCCTTTSSKTLSEITACLMVNRWVCIARSFGTKSRSTTTLARWLLMAAGQSKEWPLPSPSWKGPSKEMSSTFRSTRPLTPLTALIRSSRPTTCRAITARPRQRTVAANLNLEATVGTRTQPLSNSQEKASLALVLRGLRTNTCILWASKLKRGAQAKWQKTRPTTKEC